MKILFVGDIIGKSGRLATRGLVPLLRMEHGAFVIANGENMAGGLGITPPLAEELFGAGVDVITTGNHVFHRKEIIPFIEEERRVLRPANYASRTPGRGWGLYEGPGGIPVGVVCLQGQVFLESASDVAECVDSILAEGLAEAKVIVVDFHAEATGEKAALLHYLDGRVTAIVGTHTHVQTADERVTSRGTAFITDAGMTGPINSVIGLDPSIVLKRIKTNVPQRFKPAKGEAKLEGVLLEVNPSNGKCLSIARLRIPWSPKGADALPTCGY